MQIANRRRPHASGLTRPTFPQCTQTWTSCGKQQVCFLLLYSWFTDWCRQTSAVQQRLVCSLFHNVLGHGRFWGKGKPKLSSLKVTRLICTELCRNLGMVWLSAAQTARVKTHRATTKARHFSRTSLPMNLHFSVCNVGTTQYHWWES